MSKNFCYRRIIGYVVVFSAVLVCGCLGGKEYPAAPSRDASWAKPVEHADSNNLPNLFKVNDRLYRGAQPTKEGYAELKKMGVNTVIDLRCFRPDKNMVERAGLRYIGIPIANWYTTEKHVRRFLSVLAEEKRRGSVVFVHCKAGADRTGMMIAAYRVAVEGWTVERALDEMQHGGYGAHLRWKHIPEVLRSIEWSEPRSKK